MKITKNKGVALILSIIILTAVLAIALTAGKIFTDKIKMSRNTSDSMKAYYAAESGIEYALYQIKQKREIPEIVQDSPCPPATPIDGAFYCLAETDDGIKAIGKAGEARRGIEVALAAATGTFGAISINNPLSSKTYDDWCKDNGYTGGATGLFDDINGFRLRPGGQMSCQAPMCAFSLQCYK